jgi:predicted acyl esterase
MARQTVHMQWGIKVPMRDGINLNATLYMPINHAMPSPVIFTLTPYVGQTYHDQGVYFAENGYPYVTADVRGRGIFCDRSRDNLHGGARRGESASEADHLS